MLDVRRWRLAAPMYDVRFGKFPRGARECGGASAGVEMWSDGRGWLESDEGGSVYTA